MILQFMWTFIYPYKNLLFNICPMRGDYLFHYVFLFYKLKERVAPEEIELLSCKEFHIHITNQESYFILKNQILERKNIRLYTINRSHNICKIQKINSFSETEN